MYTILSDLDGTLLNDNNKIDNDDLSLLHKITKNNHLCIITNSNYLNLLKIISDYNLNVDFFSNTSNIARINNEYIKYEIKKEIINNILNKYEDYIYTAYTELDKCYVFNYVDRIKSFYPSDVKIINKIESDIPYLFIAISNDIKDSFIKNINELKIEYKIEGNDSKRTILILYKKKLKKKDIFKLLNDKYSDKKIIGISNSYYDIDYINLCDIKIAMNNSDNKLKEIADIITKYDNNSGGAIKELNELINDISHLK